MVIKGYVPVRFWYYQQAQQVQADPLQLIHPLTQPENPATGSQDAVVHRLAMPKFSVRAYHYAQLLATQFGTIRRL